MLQSKWEQSRPGFKRYFVIGAAAVAVSAFGATAMSPNLRQVSLDVAEVAAIDESNTTIGIADSDLYFESYDQIDAALDEMQAMGVNTVRIGIPWAGINPVEGYYDWSQSDYLINAADERGMGILAVITTTPTYQQNGSGIYSEPIDPAAYGEFAGLAAERYAGQVGAYEIWNEPNAAPFYGPAPDPAGYTELLKAAYTSIKAADPDATVVGGVVGSTITYGNFTLNPVDFVDQMYDAGAQGYFDALSFHPYQYTMPFSTGGYHPDSPLNQLDDIHDLMVTNGDGDKLIWASEYGQPTAVSSEAEQAAYLEDMLTTWREIGYTGPAFVYTLEDDLTGSTDPEATFGLIRSDGTWKPAAYVIQELAQSQETTAEMAQMALALPQAETAAPEDLAALQEIAGPTDPTTETQLAASTDQLAATAPTATVTDPAAPAVVEPTIAEPVLAQPTIAEPTISEPTIAVAPTEPTAIPTPDLDSTRSVELVDTPTTEPTVEAPTEPTPTSVVDQTRSTDLSDVPTTESPTGTASESTTGTTSDTTSGSTSDTTSGSTETSGSTSSDSTSSGSTSKSDTPKKQRSNR
ncbi:cellulase family glycosylhydrolase [Mycolicibacterium lacusdiani]|uniref:cellulase family glycosylhydrolase n=1 Tax=Mycolicibacterium lacusdiani TaxID=2895283 RepID=UPI001EFF7993|nr:cellulase family glycosylhydrolase [Mycolicibacterium lacusdiani]